jgi:tRNA/tmRNA/rRNA uracil-C5-methylase (TrmA/RlmC/RlmD family)
VSARPARGNALLDLEITRVAAGGDCVATAPDGRVVFVRHTLPGERVRAKVTESTKRFLRADAVEILSPSPDRVPPPCRYARPGRCGGCDFQHVALPRQRELKAASTRDQLVRLGGINPDLLADLVVEELPAVVEGNADGLNWRTRVQVAVRPDGRTGLHRHRSHMIEPVDQCPITIPEIEAAGAFRRPRPGRQRIEFVGVPGKHSVAVDGDRPLEFPAGGRTFRVSAGGFWQVHPAAADVLAAAVLEALAPQPGERAVDFYAGAGLFSAALAEAGCSVTSVESFVTAVEDARHNLAGLPVEVVAGSVEDVVAEVAEGVDLVVLDPPRTGAGVAVVEALVAARPRVIAYVSCDPGTLARDLKAAREAGYGLRSLRAFDLFPMTAHVECLAVLEPSPAA